MLLAIKKDHVLTEDAPHAAFFGISGKMAPPGGWPEFVSLPFIVTMAGKLCIAINCQNYGQISKERFWFPVNNKGGDCRVVYTFKRVNIHVGIAKLS